MLPHFLQWCLFGWAGTKRMNILVASSSNFCMSYMIWKIINVACSHFFVTNQDGAELVYKVYFIREYNNKNYISRSFLYCVRLYHYIQQNSNILLQFLDKHVEWKFQNHSSLKEQFKLLNTLKFKDIRKFSW